MASILKVDELQGIAAAKTVTVTVGATATQSLEQGLGKMWVNLTNAAVINDSFNVSSAVDDNTGRYTVNFTNAFTNSDYANAMIAIDADGNGFISSEATTSVRYNNYAGGFVDAPTEGMIMGYLA